MEIPEFGPVCRLLVCPLIPIPIPLPSVHTLPLSRQPAKLSSELVLGKLLSFEPKWLAHRRQIGEVEAGARVNMRVATDILLREVTSGGFPNQGS